MADYAFATVSSKNQIVIPAAVRQLLELQAGDRVEFDFQPGRIVVKKAKLAKDAYLEAMDKVFNEEWDSVEDSRFDNLL